MIGIGQSLPAGQHHGPLPARLPDCGQHHFQLAGIDNRAQVIIVGVTPR